MPQAGFFELGLNRGKQFFNGKLLQILLVEPFELGAIENRVGSADAGEREALDQFGGAENFSAVAAGPAEEREKIAESLGQEAFVAIGAYAGGAVAFGEAGAIGAQDQRDMGKDRRRGAESAVEQDLFRGVRNVVGAANDMGDAHLDVVDNSAKLIGGQGGPAAGAASRAHEDEILDFVILHFAGTKHGVFESRSGAQRNAKAYGWILMGGGGLAFAATAANDAPYFAFGGGRIVRRIAPGVFLRGAVAEIGGACGEQLIGGGSVTGQALRLEERPFIPVESEPIQSVENAFHQFRPIPLDVRVFDSKNKGATAVPGKQPVE